MVRFKTDFGKGMSRIVAGIVFSLILAACDGGASGEVDWPVYGGSASENHYSALEEINLETIDRLKPVYAVDLDVTRSNSEPVAANGVIYVTGGLSIIQAFDAVTGERLWRFEPELDTSGTKMRFGWGARGLAYDNGQVFVGAQDGQLFAIDAKTGELAWSVQTTDGADDGRYITGAPRVFDGKVIIGHGGADFSDVRGYVTCYDAVTGEQLWRFYTVPGNPADGFEDEAQEMAAETWTGEWWKHGGGGTVWNAITYDAEYNRLYIGTGNGDPWNPKIRSPEGGDNLFLVSIVALDADTGEYAWHYQQNPAEAWDYNAAMDIELATLEIDGALRKVLMQAPKNGFFYVIDREDGALISAEKLGKVTWASHVDLETGRPVENPGQRYLDGEVSQVWPGNLGLHNWPPMAFSPATGLVYISAIESGIGITDNGIDPATWEPIPGAVNNGVSDIYAGGVRPEARASLIAWDPVLGKKAWEVSTPAPWNGGVMATAGGLVFQGHIDGHLVAYNGMTGQEVWRMPVGTAAIGAPISFSVDGRQYVSIVIGPALGSLFVLERANDYGWNYRTQPPRLVTFALDASGKIPQPAYEGPEPVLVDPSMAIDPAQVSLGQSLWPACMGCHGAGVISPGSAPDLRASPMHLSQVAFASVVHDGAMARTGMPAFDEFSGAQLEALRQYIQHRARAAAD